MKDRITNILLLAIVILLGIYIYIALRDRGLIELKVNTAVTEAITKLDIPAPKDGKDASIGQVKQVVDEYFIHNPPKDGQDGQNATDEQVERSVESYFKVHPVQDGKDGANGQNGLDGMDAKTPELRCSTEKNRWEVRYGSNEAWQLLNGTKVPCVGGVE